MYLFIQVNLEGIARTNLKMDILSRPEGENVIIWNLLVMKFEGL